MQLEENLLLFASFEAETPGVTVRQVEENWARKMLKSLDFMRKGPISNFRIFYVFIDLYKRHGDTFTMGNKFLRNQLIKCMPEADKRSEDDRQRVGIKEWFNQCNKVRVDTGGCDSEMMLDEGENSSSEPPPNLEKGRQKRLSSESSEDFEDIETGAGNNSLRLDISLPVLDECNVDKGSGSSEEFARNSLPVSSLTVSEQAQNIPIGSGLNMDLNKTGDVNCLISPSKNHRFNNVPHIKIIITPTKSSVKWNDSLKLKLLESYCMFASDPMLSGVEIGWLKLLKEQCSELLGVEFEQDGELKKWGSISNVYTMGDKLFRYSLYFKASSIK